MLDQLKPSTRVAVYGLRSLLTCIRSTSATTLTKLPHETELVKSVRPPLLSSQNFALIKQDGTLPD
jgi:hypothetical protein